jgi:hypothetical protein
MSLISFFIVLQIILLFFMVGHDWIHVPPLTNIRELEKHSTKKGRVINSILFFLLIFVPLFLTCYFNPSYSHYFNTDYSAYPRWVLVFLVAVYGVLFLGTLFSWWVPYIFGNYSHEHAQGFGEYKNTHHFLPARGDNIVPNTLHVLLHVQIWVCTIIAIYLLVTSA